VGVALDDVDDIIGVTYNGVSMTQLKKQAMIGRGAGGGFNYIYGLVGPATGSSLTISATRTTGSGRIFMGAVEYTVCSATIPDATGGTTPGAPFNALATNITTVADNSAVLMFVVADNGSLAAGANTTQIAESTGASGQVGLYETSPTPVTPAGAKTLNITSAVDCNGGSIAASLAPFVAAGPANLKTYDTNVKANIKTMNTNPIANVKTFDTNA
jgi:hypothetical protein